MNTNMKIKSTIVILGGLVMGGCANLGQEEFTCNSMKKDGVCAGPHDIYEMTNHRENLENLTLEELERQVTKGDHESHTHVAAGAMVADSEKHEDVTVYEKRSLEQHTPYNYLQTQGLPA